MINTRLNLDVLIEEKEIKDDIVKSVGSRQYVYEIRCTRVANVVTLDLCVYFDTYLEGKLKYQ